MTQQEVGVARTYICGPDASTYQPWEIYRATSTGGTSLTMSLDESGNVGIGTSPSSWVSTVKSLDVGASAASYYSGGVTHNAYFDQANKRWQYKGTGPATFYNVQGGTHVWSTAASGTAGKAVTFNDAMRIDADGRVGIGGQPGTRTAADYIDQAKEKIKSWTAAIKTKLDEEPKANKKAVTLEVTDDAFEVIPTEDLVAEWMAERAIGGGDAKLQVAGTGYFNGVTIGGTTVGRVNVSGLHFGADSIRPVGPLNTTGDAVVDLGANIFRFKDAYFSGDVYSNGSPLTRTSDLIETLSTLREATQDETTLEGLRDSIGNAIGGLIEKFEAKVIQGSS